MTPTIEYSEMIHKFEPWLNERTVSSVPYEKLGLRAGAPEEARQAYAEFLADKADRRRRGLR